MKCFKNSCAGDDVTVKFFKGSILYVLAGIERVSILYEFILM